MEQKRINNEVKFLKASQVKEEEGQGFAPKSQSGNFPSKGKNLKQKMHHLPTNPLANNTIS